ncbi:hypothetical protein D9M71_791470 [compost metagenome]
MGETVAGVDPDKTRGHILDHRLGLAIDPAALERRHVTGNAEHAMAVGAIALGTGAIEGQCPGDLGGGAVANENAFEQQHQRIKIQG